MSDRYKGAILSPTAPTVTPQSAGGIYTSSQQLQYQGQGVWPTAFNNPVNNSLRFRASASAYLNRTFGTPTNNKIWTFSAWIKRGALSTNQHIFDAAVPAGQEDYIRFITSDIIQFSIAAQVTSLINTTQVFRDPSAWYNLVLACDTTQATASNRVKIYINGTQITAFGTANYPAQNSATYFNSAASHSIGSYGGGGGSRGNYFDGLITETYFIDGTQLTPSSFGTTDAYGIWQPIPYTGAYGTNGFYLPFTDNSALTTSSNVGLGKDFSGNGNYWVTNNISITAGSTYDSMKDVPTNTNSNTANYCVLSPVDTYDNPPTQGNLARIGVGHTGSPWSTCRATLGVSSGKWYFEATLTGSTGSVGNNMVGVMTTTTSTLSDAYGGSTTRSYQANGGLQGDSSTGTVSSAVSGDVIMIAFDVDAGQLWVGKNGTWMNSGVPTSGTGNVFTTLPTSPIVPQVSMYGNTGDNYGWYTNFGQQPFTYTPPTGFLPLNTYNLPTPTILDGDQYMDATLYTGNGSTQSITNAGGFQPDLVWIKDRSNARVHNIQDSVRGVRKWLESNSTNAEGDSGSIITAFNSNGFSLNDALQVNANTETYVGWQWRASNAAGVSNTQGTITSTVSANTTAGFSIFTYTGNGTAGATVGHGLGVAPNFIFIKCRSNSPTNWFVGGSNIASAGNGTWSSVMEGLNTTNAINTGATSVFNSTAPTSSLVTLGTEANANGSGRTFVMYCWAEVAGYSAFGSYTGNGSNDGPFLYTGFRPRWLLIKNTGQANDWFLMDSAMNTYNVIGEYLFPNTSAASTTFSWVDFLSNGFKIRNTGTGNNNSGINYIYACFAENPFKISRAR